MWAVVGCNSCRRLACSRRIGVGVVVSGQATSHAVWGLWTRNTNYVSHSLAPWRWRGTDTFQSFEVGHTVLCTHTSLLTLESRAQKVSTDPQRHAARGCRTRSRRQRRRGPCAVWDWVESQHAGRYHHCGARLMVALRAVPESAWPPCLVVLPCPKSRLSDGGEPGRWDRHDQDSHVTSNTRPEGLAGAATASSLPRIRSLSICIHLRLMTCLLGPAGAPLGWLSHQQQV